MAKDPFCISLTGNHLGYDRDRDFFRRDRSDFQAHGSHYPLEQLRIQSLLLQLFIDRQHFALRSDHPDIARAGLYCPTQDAHVIAMPAGNNHQVGVLVRRDARQRGFEIFCDDLACVWKTLSVGIALAIVDNHHVESRGPRNFIYVVRNVTGAEQVQQRHRQNRLQINLQCSPANQARVIPWILVQIERQRARLLFFHHLARGLPDIGLDAPAADRTDDRSVIPHQHLRCLKRRDRPAHIDDGGQGSTPSLPAHVDDLFPQVHLPIIENAKRQVKRHCAEGILRAFGKSLVYNRSFAYNLWSF